MRNLIAGWLTAALLAPCTVLAQQSAPPAAPPPGNPPPAASPAPQATHAKEADALEPAVDTSAPTEPPASGAAPPVSAGGPQPAPAASTAGGTKSGKAMDHLELGTTDITGNRELPKVLYIVPWKRSELGDLTGKPLNSLVDETLQPIDRDVFKRENRYYGAVAPKSSGGGSAPAAAARAPGGSGGQDSRPAAGDER